MKEYDVFKPYVPEIKIQEFKIPEIKIQEFKMPEIKIYKEPVLELRTKNLFEENFKKKDSGFQYLERMRKNDLINRLDARTDTAALKHADLMRNPILMADLEKDIRFFGMKYGL